MDVRRSQTRQFPKDMVRHLRALAETRPHDTALIVVRSEGETVIDYAELDRRARALAGYLQSRFKRGDRALIVLDNDDHYVVAFFACLYAGLAAVPAAVPEQKRGRHLERLGAIAGDADARCVISSDEILVWLAAGSVLDNIESVSVDTVAASLADNWQAHFPNESAIAFLQYTSGSTSAPKGVMISHRNLMANERAIEAGMSIGPDDRFVSWLPLFHDMGLVGGLLQPIHRGIPLVLAAPAYFLEQPVRWLQWISRHRGTISGGPDFAYRLCLERISDSQLKSLDLSSWRVAFSGAEPVRYATLRAFADRFAPCGFDAKALYPCYGLAEATLFVTGTGRNKGVIAKTYASGPLTKGRAVASETGTTLVSCGTPYAQHRVEIIDPKTGTALRAGRVGEIWVGGDSISPGYWRLDNESAGTFVERDGKRWLRTGDLGFVHKSQLYITGRFKDLIILRGQNVYPQDIEQAIESEVEAVRKSRIAAFSVHTDSGEAVGIAVEVSRGLQKLVSPDRLVAELSNAVSVLCHEAPVVVVLLNPGALPRTSSGKLQRSACHDGWRDRTLDAYAIYEHGQFVLGGNEPTQSRAPMDEVEGAVAEIWRSVLTGADISRHGSFFSAGGSSLSAAQIVARINERWGVQFSVRSLFEKPQLADCAAEIRRLIRAGGDQRAVRIARLAADQRAMALPLSHAQRRLWFLWQMDPTNTAYHISGRFSFSGSLDVEAMRESFAAIVLRHEALRTVFRVADDGEVRQQVLHDLTPDWASIDARHVDACRQSVLIADEVRRIQETPFDLCAGPLLRIGVIQLADAEFDLVLAIHHIVADGWSMQLLFDELAARYTAKVQRRAIELAPVPIQYIDYAAWQRDWLDNGERDKQLAWWRGYLGEDHPVLELPVDQPRRPATAYRPARHELTLSQTLVSALRKLGDTQQTTLFAVLLAAFQALLQRYTNQSDVRIGVPVANRNRTVTEGIIGPFVNTLVVRNCIDDTAPLSEILRHAAQALHGVHAHQDLPFDQLVDALRPGRDIGQSPLFRVVMNHLRMTSKSLASLPGLHLKDHWIGKQAAQFELALDTVEYAPDSIRVRITYAADLFESGTIARFADHYVRMLESFAWRPEQSVRDVELLTDAERAQLREWSVNDTRYSDPLPVHVLFEQQVNRNPHATALVFGGEDLSYAELNRRANQLAHRLIAWGVKPDTRVGIAAERSFEMVVSLLGVLKAGGAYVPFEPEYPADRLHYMLEDSGVSLLLTQDHLATRLPRRDGVPVMALGQIDLSREREDNPAVSLHGEHLVYVIYTSGSTGKPKGAANRHRSLWNRLAWMQQAYGLSAADVVLQKTPFSFDVSVWEFFWPLLQGAKLIMAAPGDHREPDRLVALIRRHQVSTLHFVPSMLQAFLKHPGIDCCTSLTRIVCSGEALALDTQNAVFRQLPWAKLYNLYGPTEAAIDVTHWTCVDEGVSAVPIGRPITSTRAFVLDSSLQWVPQGVAGELYLGGIGLARCYLGKAALTSERFIADPYSSAGERLYRTGDRVRWNARGELEYLGRIDHQVKIRGYRIELGEIESQLLAQPEVREAVVLAREEGAEKRLVGYLVASAQAAVERQSAQAPFAEELIRQWESVFDQAYEGQAIAPSFRGWNSSYTEQPIPDMEMQEWLRGTVARIGALGPGKVLEIGCGVGLLVQQLAPSAAVYVGTDLSARAVRDLRAWAATQAALAHVEVRQSEARNLSDLPTGAFDTIVLNSVAQYFPDADYLLSVLEGAVQLLSSAGSVFVGDVRHLAHLPMFHASVQLARAPGELTVRQLRGRIHKALAQDKELVLEPAFFAAVSEHLGLNSVQIELKRARCDNELTRYRYDVVLRRQHRQWPDESECWEGARPEALSELASHLSREHPQVLSVQGVPNRRLWRDRAAWQLLEQSDAQATVAEVLARLQALEPEGVDPEEFWALGEAHGYLVEICWSAGRADGAYDVQLIERTSLSVHAGAGVQPSLSVRAEAGVPPSPGMHIDAGVQPRVGTHVGAVAQPILSVRVEASEQPNLSVRAESGVQLKELPALWRTLASDPSRALRLQQLGARLRERLLTQLPEYMVPAQWVVLEALPLNANGKLDRKALPAPELANLEQYEAPQGAMEQTLAKLWSEVLGVQPIGRHDNFFALGGDSILSLQIVARTRTAGWKITPRQMFEHQTVSQLAAAATPIGAAPKAQDESLSGTVPLLPIQSWFFEQAMTVRDHWNQAVLLRSREALSTAALRTALQALVNHHDALRLRYTTHPDHTRQQFYAPKTDAAQDALWIREAPTAAEAGAIFTDAQRSLNLVDGPLLRAVWIRLSDGTSRLLLTAHHLVVDAVSWRILLEDLWTAYRQAHAGQRVALPEKTSSYQSWAEHIHRYAESHADELAYWQGLADTPADLPCDNAAGSNSLSDQSTLTLRLNRAQTHALLKEAPAAYRAQVTDLLVTALVRALGQWSGCDRVRIDLESHGREAPPADLDVSRTVGWFASLFPVLLDAQGDLGLSLRRVKETLRQVPNHGIGFGALKYAGTHEQRHALNALPAAPLMFNYLGQLDAAVDHGAPWVLATEPVGILADGRAVSPYEFSINGYVRDGELRLDVSFSGQRHRCESVQRWIDCLQAELEQLITHRTKGIRAITPSDFPLATLTQAQLDELPVSPEQLQDLYPLSPMQQGLLFHSLHYPEGDAYVSQLRMDVDGLDTKRFIAAWQAALARHDVLRSGFLYERETPLQWVATEAPLPFTEYDWRECEDQSARLAELASSQRTQRFNLAQPPLMRFVLVRVRHTRHHFIWTHHHLLTDGWSIAQLLDEVLLQHYGQQPTAPLAGRYRDYIRWLQQRDFSASEQYWKASLRCLEGPTRLSDAVPMQARGEGHYEHLDVYDPRLTQSVLKLAKRQQVTVTTVVQAAWSILLRRYTGQHSLVFGITSSGRPAELPTVENIAGLFINTSPMIATLGADQRVGEWLRELQARNAELREHGHTPLHDIQRWAGSAGQSLFDTLVVVENYPVDERLRKGATANLRLSNVSHRYQTHYPLTLIVEHSEALNFRYVGDRRFFTSDSVANIAAHARGILDTLATSAELCLGEIGLLSQPLRASFNLQGTREPQPIHKPMHEPIHVLIEQQARLRPHAVALVFEDLTWTYAELNRRANQLAHRLMALGVKPETRVGVAMERSLGMVVTLIAILKAGGAYVPLDPGYPAERLAYLVRDSGIALLVVQADSAAKQAAIAVLDVPTLAVPALDELDAEPETDPHVRLHPDNLAYVIYTSGSTGQPKGAQLCHGNVARLLESTREWFHFDERDVWTLFHSYAFDFSVWEIFGALCHGGRLVVVPLEVSRSPRELILLLEQQRVTVLNQTPSAFKQLLQVPELYDGSCEGPSRSLRVVIFGGEALDPRCLRPWIEHFGDAKPRLINMYGITETTVHVTFRPVTRADLDERGSPIGEPMADLRLRVLDSDLNALPVGIAGELYVTGAGLARGYLHQAALTSDRFVADPFSSAGQRLYRTGDRVRWNDARELEYLGRTDRQVKIRGFRIELGEIESQLMMQPEVRDVAVIAQEEPAGVRLVAYLAGDPAMNITQIRQRLAQAMPDYMVPAAWVLMESLPLNVNGKLDRGALPQPERAIAANYEPPQGAAESALAALWAEVLGVDRVGRGDNFFEIGGHSLSAGQISMLLAQRHGCDLPVRYFFERHTLAELASSVDPELFATARNPTQRLAAMSSLIDELEVS